jgi:predicted DNA-binding transcriptional regulator YafY
LSRTARLLELLIRVQTKPRFTAAELAEEFGVSRRTMLRDLGRSSVSTGPTSRSTGTGRGIEVCQGRSPLRRLHGVPRVLSEMNFETTSTQATLNVSVADERLSKNQRG